MRSTPTLRDILLIEWKWAGYLPPSCGRNNRRIDIVRRMPGAALQRAVLWRSNKGEAQ